MKLFHIAILFFACTSLSAQNQPLQYKFRVYLKDKGQTKLSVSEPEKFLTQQSIDRKKRQEVEIDESDFPISPDYFRTITRSGAKTISHSKWLKTIVVQLNDSAQIDTILQLPFVDSAKYVWRGAARNIRNNVRPRLSLMPCLSELGLNNFFGLTQEQFALHNAQNMILSGYGGKKIKIAVIDAGFSNFDVVPLFGNINVIGFKNFVPQGEIFASSDHGTKVLSSMAANLPDLMMGSAPAAQYLLLRSEDSMSEFPVEEDYWVRAIEYADSVGVDLVNTSLGYSKFDDKSLNYKHEDLNGETSLISKASAKAVEKGMLLVTSAGNEGGREWQKISVPGDSKNVITVGAVGTDSIVAPFSSKGYTHDGRVKPDVVSVGRGTIAIGYRGLFEPTNGTSLSSPFFAGLVASLWSIHPELNRFEMMEIVKKSAHKYNRPDSVYGYGIPDFGKAMKEVLGKLEVNEKSVTEKFFSISRLTKNDFLITLAQPELSFDAHLVNLLDESGNIISTNRFEKETLNISIPPETRKVNKFVHLVFKSPYEQKTVRFKL